MQNRIKAIRKLRKMSQYEFAKMLNVDQTAVSNWENGKNGIDIGVAKQIAETYKLPLEFIYGCPYTLQRPMDEWHPDELDDYERSGDAKTVLEFRYGRGAFDAHIDESLPYAYAQEGSKLSNLEQEMLKIFRSVGAQDQGLVLDMIRLALNAKNQK